MGEGGSILTVPALVYLMGVGLVLSTAYSLLVVGSTSLVGALGYFRRGLVSLRTAVVFLIPLLAAVFLVRKVLVPAIPREVLALGGLVVTKDLLVLLAFAGLMVSAAASMIRSRQVEEVPGTAGGRHRYAHRLHELRRPRPHRVAAHCRAGEQAPHQGQARHYSQAAFSAPLPHGVAAPPAASGGQHPKETSGPNGPLAAFLPGLYQMASSGAAAFPASLPA